MGSSPLPFPYANQYGKGAPLLFAIAMDSFSCRIQQLVDQGLVQGVSLPGKGKPMTLQLFADDTNALLKNDPHTILQFWLETFYVASGSVINHQKIGIKTEQAPPSPWMLAHGCQEIPEGQVFRLLGIPMGFSVTMKARWNWVFSRLEDKLKKWSDMQLSLAGRRMVLNHFLIPSCIYYLAC